ncbi:transposase family protein [Streptomyces sp. NBC_01808]|uniref:transposase family protein n=1 Tax=Streptomyces sp. NBC_01808 TaxID=2975947 RepID=UPI002DDA0E44|nr:transposase family protein [Streptomyces sp. NBC_01808]WSA40260.1 transposase family protein [Streptomyces sp. NBC_01808]
MPAAPSSLVPAVLAKLGPLHQHDTGRLRAHLQRVPDPRSRRGRWYPLVGLLLICACAVVSGARTITEITEPGTARHHHGAGTPRHPPPPARTPARSVVHTGSAPRAIAALRNPAIGRLRLLGADNIAKTTRAIRDAPEHAIRIWGITDSPPLPDT